jgi:hypothetical protein
MDFANDLDFNPYMLRGGGDDTQDYVVPATGFSISLNNFFLNFACVPKRVRRSNT